MSIWVCGEVLIDLIPDAPGSKNRVAHVGGGPANTAKALTNLGLEVEFIDGISTDNWGAQAKRELIEAGVKLNLIKVGDQKNHGAILPIVK